MKLIAAIGLLGAVFFATGAVPQAALSPADQRVADIAARSGCAGHRWNNRGRAPVGYIKGVALVYAKSFCESKRSADTAVTVMQQPLGSIGQDAMVWYDKGGPTAIERLRALYTLGIGLGMRESSGNTTEGRDITASHPSANTAEAGLFQTSFDSFRLSPRLPQLFDQYQAGAACRLEVFKEGVRVITRPVFGAGPGAEFQRFTRACPAFATEYVMVMLRINRKHFGPINRKEAEYFQPCNDMLKEVETVAVCTP